MINRVLVIGSSGQLGQSLRKVAGEFRQLELEFVERSQLDLSVPGDVTRFFSTRPVDDCFYIINAAAYTAVDKAETEPELVNQVNHLAVQELAEIAYKKNIFLLHVSTDYVFDGKSYRPWQEIDPVAPLNVYGRSKLGAEKAIQASGCRGTIVRTGWLYSEFGNNFVKSMLHSAAKHNELGVVVDQVGTPTYASDLARALLQLLLHKYAPREQRLQKECRSKSKGFRDVRKIFKDNIDLYHYSNEGVCSWYDFAREVFDLSGISCQVKAIASSDWPSPIKRPHYSVLNKSKIAAEGVQIPYWRDSLSECLFIINHDV